MSRKVEQFFIFISAPDGLETERKRVKLVCEELNRTICFEKEIVLTTIQWNELKSGKSNYTQNVLNQQIEKFDYDLYVGIMGKNFGTPTKDYGSGTEEEFFKAVERWDANKRPKITFYFKKFSKKETKDINQDEFKKVDEFKVKVKNSACFYKEFTRPINFEREFRESLLDFINNELKPQISTKDKNETLERIAFEKPNNNPLDYGWSPYPSNKKPEGITFFPVKIYNNNKEEIILYPERFIGNVLKLNSKPKEGIDYKIKSLYSTQCKTVEIICHNLEQGISAFEIKIKVKDKKKSNHKIETRFLSIVTWKISSQPTERDSLVFPVFIRPEPLKNKKGWEKIVVNLSYEVDEILSQFNLKYEEIILIRLRGQIWVKEINLIS